MAESEFELGDLSNQQDESTLSMFQDMNQTGNSFDLTSQLINQTGNPNMSNVSNFFKLFNQNQMASNKDKPHDTSNIDTLVTKSLEISRSYRRFNSSINNNSQLLLPVDNTVKAKAQLISVDANNQKTKLTPNNGDELKRVKQQRSNKVPKHQKKPESHETTLTENILKEYNQMKTSFENLNTKDLRKNLKTFMHVSSSSSSSLSSVNSNKLMYNQNKLIIDQPLHDQPMSSHEKLRKKTSKDLKSSKNAIEELSEIMSESIDNEIIEIEKIDGEAHAADENNEQYEDYDEDDDDDADESRDDDSDDDTNSENNTVDKKFNDFMKSSNVAKNLINYKHESTTAYDDDYILTDTTAQQNVIS
jgi:hypothetical protein